MENRLRYYLDEKYIKVLKKNIERQMTIIHLIWLITVQYQYLTEFKDDFGTEKSDNGKFAENQLKV